MEHNPPKPAAATDDDERDSGYRGVFTQHRSADFMLKICFTLFVFVVLLVLTSLHITRKKYRLPRLLHALRLRQKNDLLRLDGVAPLAALKNGEAVAGAIPGGWVILHRIELRGVRLPVQQFTCAPEWLRDESLGLLLSLDSPERSILAQLVDYAFQDLPEARIEAVVHSEVQRLAEGKLNLLDDFAFDMAARHIVLRLVFGLDGSSEASARETFRKLSSNLEDLRGLHYGTKRLHALHRLAGFLGLHHRTRDVLADSKRTLEPLIRYEMENYDPSDPSGLSTFLQTFMASRIELEEEGDQTNFLTVGHLAHASLDALLVLEDTLVPALRWAVLLLAERPDLADRLAQEGRRGRWAEAAALELVRWSLVGSQFCARQLLDDWSAGDTDLPVGSVLLFDLRSFTRDPQLFRQPDAFRPQRFEGRPGAKAAFLERLEAAGWAGCVPAGFLLDLIAVALGQLSAAFKVKAEGNSALEAAPLSFTKMPAPFQFALRAR